MGICDLGDPPEGYSWTPYTRSRKTKSKRFRFKMRLEIKYLTFQTLHILSFQLLHKMNIISNVCTNVLRLVSKI